MAGYRKIIAITKLDPDPNIDARAVQRFAAEVDIEIHCCDAESGCYPVPTESVNVFCAFEVLEHLSADPMAALAEANRILVSNGTLALSTPNIAGWRCVLRVLRGRNPNNWSVYATDPGLSTVRHHREYTAAEVVRLVSAAGMKPLRLSTPTYPDQTGLRTRMRELYTIGLILLAGGSANTEAALHSWLHVRSGPSWSATRDGCTRTYSQKPIRLAPELGCDQVDAVLRMSVRGSQTVRTALSPHGDCGQARLDRCRASGRVMGRSSLRRALLNPTWSIIAPDRSKRPRPLDLEAERSSPVCPFCEGNESETASEVFAIRRHGTQPDQPGWTVRVVPNKYPAVSERPAKGLVIASAPHEALPAFGVHEVVIYSPDHDRQISLFPTGHIETALKVYRLRLLALTTDSAIKSVALFRNVGKAAGASQEHPHTQIVALSFVPSRLQQEVDAAERYLRHHERCITCDILRQELRDTRHLIVQNPHFVAVTSFSPRFPYETWIVPKSHSHDFRECSNSHISHLAAVVKQVLTGFEVSLGRFPFNLVLHTAPVQRSSVIEQAFHWRLEILPRLTIPSGFELGHGVFIVSVPPEEAASTLRAAIPAATLP